MASRVQPATCPVCKGFGAVETPEGRAVTCQCRVGDLVDVRLRAAQIPERYRDCKIENYKLNLPKSHPSHAKARARAKRFIEDWKACDRGLLFVGPVGVGKTHLAVAILRTLVEENAVKGVFCDFSDLLERIQARRPTDWVRDVLYGLINTRYNRQRITIVTSNYGDAAGPNGEEPLEKRVGTMVRSRLYEMCDLVVLDGADYRAMRAVRV
jgi:DNA replication protein DnaC